MSIITIDNLTYTYGGSETKALDDVSLTVSAGEWVVLQGVTGSGKSTLLKTITGACPEFYGGTIAGRVAIAGQQVEAMTAAERVQRVGFVGQDPEAQLVYAAADREVAFALENVATHPTDMEWRVAEALELVGLSPAALRPTAELSGGEKQRLAVAAAMVHQPKVLLLDEPTSQLDPVSTNDLLDHLRRLQQDFGITIVLAEHRLDAVYGLADQVVYMESGKVAFAGPARETACFVREHALSQAPSLVRLFPTADVPVLSVQEARRHVQNELGSNLTASEEEHWRTESVLDGSLQQPVLTVNKVTASYPGWLRPVLDGCSVTIAKGALTAVVGPNGSGKSTLLKVLAGLLKPQSGRVTSGTVKRDSRDSRNLTEGSSVPEGEDATGPRMQSRRKRRKLMDKSMGRVRYLPQKPSDLFSQLTVRDELQMGLSLQGRADEEIEAAVSQVVSELQLERLLHRAPRDLSGGEQMRVALASLLVDAPDVLLLDEPTRGLDAGQKDMVTSLLKGLTSRGMTIVMVSHDMDLVADAASQIVFLFHGRVVLEGEPERVFSKALYFSPSVARVFRGFDDEVISLKRAISRGWAR